MLSFRDLVAGVLTATEVLGETIITDNGNMVWAMIARLWQDFGDDIPAAYLEFIDNLSRFSPVAGICIY